MKPNCVFVVFSLIFLNVYCQYDQSPCPELFSYQSDGHSLFGFITLKSTGGAVSVVRLRANFTVAARLTTTYIGQIEAIGNDQLLQKFNRGQPLNYRVHFPVTSPLPRLTSIVVNGDILCLGRGDVPGPLQYVTTLSLDHMLYLKSGSNPQIFSPYEPQESEFEFTGSLGDNTQIFTVNEIGNRDGTWTSGYPTTLIKNNTRPSFEKPGIRPIYEMPERRSPRPHSQVSSPFSGIYPTTLITNNTRPFFEKPGIRPIYEKPEPRPPLSQSNQRPQPETILPVQPKPDLTPIQRPDYNYYPVQSQPQQTTPPPQRHPVPTVLPLPPTPQRLPSSSNIECGVLAGGNERVPLIYNGNSYPRGDWPWLVAIYRRAMGSLTFICSGTLVSDRHIVTAAHCMHLKNKLYEIKDMVVKVGVYNLEDWGDDISVTRTVQSAYKHEAYNATSLENDILVFTMERSVEFNAFIRPACLWNGNTDLLRIVGASGVVAGWGASEYGTIGKGEPRMVRIPVVSTAACRASKPDFHHLTSSRTLCAGDRNGSGPCLGDSGGGLYILDNGRWRLRGIVSVSLRAANGEATCNLDEYIVFTDSAQYLKWIKKIMSQNLYDK